MSHLVTQFLGNGQGQRGLAGARRPSKQHCPTSHAFRLDQVHNQSGSLNMA